jgi:hypothetical protein
MKPIATVRITRAVARYGEHAPNAAVCCNACRTCVQTNLIGLALAAVGGAAMALTRVVRRNHPAP